MTLSPESALADSEGLVPHNIEAEQAFLGALLYDNEIWHKVADWLSPEQFYDPVHARIYAACASRIARGSLADAVALKTAFERDEGLKEIGGMGEVAGEQPAQKGGGNPCLVVRIELLGEVFPQVAPNNRGDAKVSARPQALADGGAGEPSHDRGGVGHRPGRGEEAGTLPLLLDHHQLEGRPGQRRHNTGGDAARHLLLRFQLRPAGIAQDDLLQRPADGELDHGAGPHIDAVGPDAAVQLARVEGQGLALLEHVLPVVEGLQAQDLDDPNRHADGGVLQLVQFGRHGSCWFQASLFPSS